MMTPTRVTVLVLAAASFAAALPQTYRYIAFAFGDKGWAIATDVLLDEGLRPVTDFGYFYGLLTLVIDRALFAVVGRTPAAVVGLDAACAAAVALGVVRVMRATGLTGAPAVFLAAVTPLYVMPILYPSPSHALEAALLAHALAEHAARRPGRALALVTVAVFIKPSLGYFYGLILLVMILAGWPGGSPGRWRRLLPAVGVGVPILALLVATFGWEAVVRTQVPLDGMRAYKDSGFGFLFGSGRKFWVPDHPDPLFYLLTPAGVWLASSAAVLVTAVRLLPRFREPASNLVAACAVLHLVFVFVLFGNQWSWIYYPHLLFVGAAVGLHAVRVEPGGGLKGGWGRWAAVALTVLGVLGHAVSIWPGQAVGWMMNRRSAETAGLFAHPQDTAEIAQARALGRSGRVFVLTRMGAARQLAPEFDAPRSWCLARATATPGEWARLRAGVDAADWVLAPEWHDNDLVTWPELADVLRPFHPVVKTPLYILYRRQPPSVPADGRPGGGP